METFCFFPRLLFLNITRYLCVGRGLAKSYFLSQVQTGQSRKSSIGEAVLPCITTSAQSRQWLLLHWNHSSDPFALIQQEGKCRSCLQVTTAHRCPLILEVLCHQKCSGSGCVFVKLSLGSEDKEGNQNKAICPGVGEEVGHGAGSNWFCLPGLWISVPAPTCILTQWISLLFPLQCSLHFLLQRPVSESVSKLQPVSWATVTLGMVNYLAKEEERPLGWRYIYLYLKTLCCRQ
jgi:hypothetical protein